MSKLRSKPPARIRGFGQGLFAGDLIRSRDDQISREIKKTAGKAAVNELLRLGVQHQFDDGLAAGSLWEHVHGLNVGHLIGRDQAGQVAG